MARHLDQDFDDPEEEDEELLHYLNTFNATSTHNGNRASAGPSSRRRDTC